MKNPKNLIVLLAVVAITMSVTTVYKACTKATSTPTKSDSAKLGGKIGEALNGLEQNLSANEKALNARGLSTKGSHAVKIADQKK